MSAELLIDHVPGETRAAFVSNGRLDDLIIERDARPSLVGRIYRARVDRVMPGIRGAFILIGRGEPAFLSFNRDRSPAAPGPLTDGATVLVQVTRDAHGEKGPQVTRRLSLPGRYIVYVPSQREITLSRRLIDEREIRRLRGVLSGLLEPDEGVILRTEAIGADPELLARELAALRADWRAIEDGYGREGDIAEIASVPSLGVRMLRDRVGPDTERVVFNDRALRAEAEAYCERFLPEFAARLELHTGPDALFEECDIEAEIEVALDRRVRLPSGGEIVIDRTEALTAIDVNSAGFSSGTGREDTALRINLEAADEIGRQLRLRGIGGVIIIDFISFDRNANWKRVTDALEQSLRQDGTPFEVFGVTHTGLVEMTRRRQRRTLAAVCLESRGPDAHGLGSSAARNAETLACDAMRLAIADTRGGAPGTVTISARADIYDRLNGDADGSPGRAAALGRQIGRPVKLERLKESAAVPYQISVGS